MTVPRRGVGLLTGLVPSLHFRSWPSAVQAVLAPLQSLHLALLERSLSAAPLEENIRHLLFPSETMADANRWRGNLRFVAWLRSAYLRSHPDTKELLPHARSILLERHRAPWRTPITMEEARTLFGLEHPKGTDRQPALPRAMERAASAATHAEAVSRPADRCTRDIPFGDLIEMCGGLVENRGPLSVWCEERGAYELITSELIAGIADYIETRQALLQIGSGRGDTEALEAAVEAADAADAEVVALATTMEIALADWTPSVMVDDSPRTSSHTAGPLRVLEVGAGNGELSHYLRQALRNRGTDALVVATDSQPWSETVGRVERVDVRSALQTYRPHLVVCSWMPMGVDWSKAFRDCPSVGEYLLLGEVFDGATGNNYETWGNPAFAPPHDESNRGRDSSGTKAAATSTSPPHECDGWELVEVESVSRWMVSRFASDTADCECASAAIAFRRRTLRSK
jgi:hypothetical protein